MKRKSRRYDREFHPETLALGLGYDPKLSEGAVKTPVFLTSTFQFESSQAGKRFFEAAYGLQDLPPGHAMGLIYSRLNNPNLEIYEGRVAAWEQMDKGALFASGLAAISTSLLALLRPGDIILSTQPVYGGTHFLFEEILPTLGIETIFVNAGDQAPAQMRQLAEEHGESVRMIYVESPANPSLVLTDLGALAELARSRSTADRRVLLAVDNTILGPLFQRPGMFDADLVFYSATKFLGGHSDCIAGVTLGSEELMQPIMTYRTILGTMADPFTAWMLTRSLETVSIRMRRQAKSAAALARLLQRHPKVKTVYYPGGSMASQGQQEIFERQCTGSGSLISFEVEGGEEAAFAVLDRFEVVRLAVSLGGTESLVEHPMRMTHADVPPAELDAYGVTPSMIRISVGLEHVNDLRRDLLQALSVLGPADGE